MLIDEMKGMLKNEKDYRKGIILLYFRKEIYEVIENVNKIIES